MTRILAITKGTTGGGGAVSSVSNADGTLTISPTTGSVVASIANNTALPGSPTTTTQSPGDSTTKIATTAFVTNAVLGQDFKQAVNVATTSVLATYTYNNGSSGVGATITAIATGVISFDGTALTAGMRVLVKNETSTNTPNNGIYTVTVAGAIGVALILTRATDFDQSTDIDTGDSVFVLSGTTQSTTTWAYNGANNPTMGTTNITFAQTAGQGSFTAGTGITITGNSIALTTPVTVANGGTGTGTAGIGAFNNITGLSAAGTTGTTSTNLVFSTSPTLVTPNIGTPSAGVLTNATGLPVPGGLSATGTPSSTTYLRGDGSWSTPTGSGTVNSGTAGRLAFYSTTGTAVSDIPYVTVTGGSVLNVGISGTQGGGFSLSGLTSGATTVITASVAGGTVLLPGVAGSDTIALLTAAQTFTNKTLTSPTLTTPALGTATGTGLILTGSSATLLAAGLNGSTNPAFNVDASTATSATGLNIKSAAAAGGLAVSVLSSGAAENLTINAKGTGTIGIGSVSTGAVTITPATTITGALTLSSTVNKVTITAPATSATLTLVTGSSLITTGAFATTLAASASTTVTLPGTSSTMARTDAAQTFTGIQTFSSIPVLPNNSISGAELATNAITLSSPVSSTSQTSISTAAVILTGLTTTVTNPAGGRTLRIEVLVPNMASSAITTWTLYIYNSATVTGSAIATIKVLQPLSSVIVSGYLFYEGTFTAGSQSFCAAISCDAGSGQTQLTAIESARLSVSVE